MTRRWFPILLSMVATVALAFGMPPGSSGYTLRGARMDVYFLPAQGAARPCAVLFLPGDGGWGGYAVEMARRISAMGYPVYGFDIKTYLTAFTGTTTLSQAEMGRDLREMIAYVHAQSGLPVVAAGWSQGANMAVLGGSASKSDRILVGVVAIGLAPRAVLGWRFIDNLTYLTRKPPDEPTFDIQPSLESLPPVPIVMIASPRDEFVSEAETEKLAESLGDPKRVYRIPAQDHRFTGKREEFFRAVQEGLEWLSALQTAGEPREE